MTRRLTRTTATCGHRSGHIARTSQHLLCSTCRLGAGGWTNGAHSGSNGSEYDAVAVAERMDRMNEFPSQRRAVLAAEVLESDVIAGKDDPRMATGDRRRIDPDPGIGFAAHNVLPLSQIKFAIADHELPQRRPILRHVTIDVGPERETESIHRANDCVVLIVQRFAQLIDEVVHIRFLDEGVRPKQIVEFHLRYRFGMTPR